MLGRMHFSGTWRDYQARVLDELGEHFSDGQIHVVAAPGSGKTILGLEIVRRMGQTALVLSPTSTIRDQWLHRLVPLFLPAAPAADEVSSSLAVPAQFTSATYQALHAVWADGPGPPGQGDRFAALVTALEAHGPLTLVLDEAHHLRREWWNALLDLTGRLSSARIVALTATPPYDAPQTEWARYCDLCGPIDLEIGIPELVRNGDLCPHQDHVVFSSPGTDALALLDARREAIAHILDTLRGDGELIAFFEQHPWLTDPEAQVEAILEAPEMLSAVLVFLASCGRSLPGAPLRLLGVKADQVPLPSAMWSEILLNGLLFTQAETFPIGPERSRWLRGSLGEAGVIEGGKVRLMESRSIFQLMAGNLGKLDAIARIAHCESESLGAGLRLLVLSDHVRVDELHRSLQPGYQPAKLGVVPIFAALRTALPAGQELGLLSGKLVLIPLAARSALIELARLRGIDPGQIECSPLPGDPAYLHVRMGGNEAQRLVELVSELFVSGQITMLVGTQALLGEGWDAPALNSLVLASNSAAFMLSNQMRGRALRIDPNQPGKVANIWHLATVAQPPDAPWSGLAATLGWGSLGLGDKGPASELAMLERRFRAFEGIANGGAPSIEGGMTRLGLGAQPSLDQANAQTFAYARDRQAIADAWRRSLGEADPRAHVRQTARPNYAPQALALHDTLRWLATGAGLSGLLAMADQLRDLGGDWTTPANAAMALAGAGLIAALPKLAKAGWLAWRNGSLEGSLEAAGLCVLHGLHSAGSITDADFAAARIEVRHGLNGVTDIIVRDVSRSAERLVMEALGELLGPIENPRYMLVRKSWLGPRLRTDWHALPGAIARNSHGRDSFVREWHRRIGSSKLLYTRTTRGRRELLRARANSLIAGLRRRVDRRSVWM